MALAAAAPFHQCLLLLFTFTCLVVNSPHGLAVLLPVTKDAATHQYLTQIHLVNPPVPIKLVVDLGGPFLWVDCASGKTPFSSRPIPSCSLQCSAAKADSPDGINSCLFSASNIIQPCDLSTQNSITRLAIRGELVEDVATIGSATATGESLKKTIDRLVFSCAPTFLLNGLASGTRGMLGLGRTRLSLTSQLDAAFGLPRKFIACLSPSNGFILFGHTPSEVSGSLMYTPLVTDAGTSGIPSSSQEYLINVKSIKINGNKRLSLNQEGIKWLAKISTIQPYTTMESSLYSQFLQAYENAAKSMNMTRVASAAPFGLCFSTEGTEQGSAVPTIDLALQSEMVKWRIGGRNSLVVVSQEVMCVGFLNGGLDTKPAIVIGGLQLEDTMLEFDLGGSMLGFSSSLLSRQTSCSKFMFQSSLNVSI